MSWSDFLNFWNQFAPRITSLLSVFTRPIGEVLPKVIVGSLSVLIPADITLVHLLLGTFVTIIIPYTLLKWVLSIF